MAPPHAHVGPGIFLAMSAGGICTSTSRRQASDRQTQRMRIGGPGSIFVLVTLLPEGG
jgi:hypothetical protein